MIFFHAEQQTEVWCSQAKYMLFFKGKWMTIKSHVQNSSHFTQVHCSSRFCRTICENVVSSKVGNEEYGQQPSGLYRQKWTNNCLESGRGFSDFHPYWLSLTFEFKQVGEKSEAIFLILTENWGEGGKIIVGGKMYLKGKWTLSQYEEAFASMTF